MALESLAAGGCGGAKYGLWLGGLYDTTTQKKRKYDSGYKSTTFGGSAGFDARVNDDVILGAAFTYGKTDIKHKDLLKGDKSTIDSYLLSLYGLHQITDHWFLNTAVGVGTHKVTLKTYDTKPVDNTVSKAKFDATSFSAEIAAGYNHAMGDHVLVTPTFGLRYSNISHAGYEERDGFSNLNAEAESTNKLAAVAGLKIAGKKLGNEHMMFTPDLHGSVEHDLIKRKSTPNINVDWIGKLYNYKHRAIRTRYSVGVGLAGQFKSFELGLSYDLKLAEKRMGHSGSLTARFNF